MKPVPAFPVVKACEKAQEEQSFSTLSLKLIKKQSVNKLLPILREKHVDSWPLVSHLSFFAILAIFNIKSETVILPYSIST